MNTHESETNKQIKMAPYQTKIDTNIKICLSVVSVVPVRLDKQKNCTMLLSVTTRILNASPLFTIGAPRHPLFENQPTAADI